MEGLFRIDDNFKSVRHIKTISSNPFNNKNIVQMIPSSGEGGISTRGNNLDIVVDWKEEISPLPSRSSRHECPLPIDHTAVLTAHSHTQPREEGRGLLLSLASHNRPAINTGEYLNGLGSIYAPIFNEQEAPTFWSEEPNHNMDELNISCCWNSFTPSRVDHYRDQILAE